MGSLVTMQNIWQQERKMMIEWIVVLSVWGLAVGAVFMFCLGLDDD